MAAVVASASTAWAATLFEHAPIGQALVAPDGRWVRLNPALGRLLGRDPDELVGTSTNDVVHPDDRAASLDAGRRLLGGESAIEVVEHRLVRPDGQLVWARLTAAIVTDALGRPRYIVGQVEDLGEERSLALESRRNRAMVDAASDLVVVLNAEVNITYASSATEALLGRSVAEVLGTPALDHVHPDDRELAATELLDVFVVTPGSVPTPIRLLHADGSPVAVEALAVNLLDDDAVGGVVVSLRDVRDRDASSEALTALDLRYRALADAARDAIVTVDDDDVIWSWNAGARNTLGHAAEWAIGRSITVVLPDGLPAGDEVAEVDAHHAAGHAVPVEVTVSAYEHAGLGYRLAILRDVTARREAERAARAADVRFLTAFAAAPIGMAIVGLDGTFLEVNTALCTILGRDAADLESLRFQDVTHPDDLDADLGFLARLLDGSIPGYRMEKRYQRADGDLVWAQLSVTLVRAEDGEPLHFISQVEDITERKALDDDLAYQAHHDSLTGLLNRHAALRRFEQALARRHLVEVTVLFVDLDEFKVVNDTWGHAAGDEVLRTVGRRITEVLRPADVAARIGGDEFVAVLEGLSGAEAAAVADRLTRVIAEPVPVGPGVWAQVAASVGFATATTADAEVAGVLARADRAMYEIKRRAKAVTRT